MAKAKGSLAQDSVASASSLIGLQLFSRLFTFIFNSALVRMVSPSVFGTAAIQFEFLLSTILFLSREGVRNAVLRVKKSGPGIDNMSFLPICIGLPLAVTCSVVFIKYASQEVRLQPYYEVSVLLYGGAALIELFTEPYHNKVMGELKTHVRVRAEGLGVTIKSMAAFLVLFYDAQVRESTDLALLAFAVGQIMYSFTMLQVYSFYCGVSPLLPNTSSSLDSQTLWLSLTMTGQSFVKHFLTEGDKLLLSYFSPLQDQGGYALAVNYGSLVARIVFQPIEETLRVFFSKTLSDVTSPKEKGKAQQKSALASLKQASSTLSLLLSTQLSFSLILLTFGVPFIPFVLQIALPRQYLQTSAPQVLTAWIWYIPVLAINGALEAFLASTASYKDLLKQSQYMAIFSAIYISAAIGFYRLDIGDASLVYANIINLSARISYCLFFITSFFSERDPALFKLRDVWPSRSVVSMCVLSSGVIYGHRKYLNLSEHHFELLGKPFLTHFGLGGILGLACVGTWWFSSGRYIKMPSAGKSEKTE